ncbi:MAG: tripartite tricarboxylate transporter substrate binding protein [Betaproteobacteria bacterium]|nr:tripartite tricarboxylate transporter substrate binding protein [Betaproteobacteria bacterium]MDH5210228.1 tripartite tricarboxylate transporter substrate binding protein [Betaproteobacteria bacterium]MDH5577832.1 tripartite tricarboxylate transporter substrate binding protein [Betaproteobacteria bacterium]
MTRLAIVLAALLWSLQAAAQAWPAKPVRIVVPLGAGGFADVPARILAPRLGAQLGGTTFVENRPGAGSTIGADHVAKADPDGHTLLFTATPHVISAWLYKTLQYDSLKSFAPVALVAAGPYVLVVHPDLAVSSVAELVAAAKAQPGKIDYASSGNGSAQHLVTALFATTAGIDLNHVPYKGSGQAMQDVLGGRVKVHFAGVPNVINHVRAGKLRALGVTGTRRWPEMPDVPTIAEAGVSGYEATLWLCMLAPAGTPDAIVNRVSAEIGKALQDPEVLAQLRNAGIAPSYLGPQEFGAFMRAEHEKWGRVVKATGATIN